MENSAYRNFIFKYGLVTGVVGITITVITYILGIEYMTSIIISILSLLILISLPIYAGIKWRQETGGYISFGKAFTTVFLVFALAFFISTLFNMTLYTVIDPELPGKIQEAVIDKTLTMMENMGAPDESIEEALERLESMEGKYSIGNLVTGYFQMLIIGAIIAAIAGLIIKKEKPEIEGTTDEAS